MDLNFLRNRDAKDGQCWRHRLKTVMQEKAQAVLFSFAPSCEVRSEIEA